MKKYLAILSFLIIYVGPSRASKVPPDAMIGVGREIPVAIEPVAGAVVDSVATSGINALHMSFTVGEAVSGLVSDTSGKCQAGENCRIEMGYGVFEFYSDRIPLNSLVLTINGGKPVTNSRNVILGISFTDDLSGFKSASVTERISGNPPTTLNLLSQNFISLTLGSNLSSAPDDDYFYDFQFVDNADNITIPDVSASIRLDTVEPSSGTIVINNNDLFTNTSTVTVTLSAIDGGPAPTGVDKVRLSTSPTVVLDGKVFSFIEPQTSFKYYLGNDVLEQKTIYAQFGDAAGNWTSGVAIDTITRGAFSPNGTVTVVSDPLHLVLLSSSTNLYQTDLTKVGFIFAWDPNNSDMDHIVIRSGPILPVQPDLPILPSSNPYPFNYSFASSTSPDGHYDFGVYFVDSIGNESIPSTFTFSLSKNGPGTPKGKILSVSTDSFTIQIDTDSNPNILDYSFDPVGFSIGASSAVIANSTMPIIYTDYQLVPNTKYGYQVTANEQFTRSFPPLSLSANTLAEIPVNTQLPDGVEVNVIRVFWGVGSNPLGTEYSVEWSSDPATIPYVVHDIWSPIVPYDVVGLTMANTYYFRVKARNGDNVETPYTYLGSTMTLSFIQPQTPYSLFVSKLFSTSLEWSWGRYPSTEEGFILADSNGIPVADIPLAFSISTYTHLETGLTPDTLYSRNIVSYNHFVSLSSRTFSSPPVFAQAVTSPAPPVPKSLTVVGSEITAQWDTNGNPSDTEYNAQISADPQNFSSQNQSDWITASNYPLASYTFSGLLPHTTYYVRVQSQGRLFQGVPAKSAQVDLGSLQTQTFDHSQSLDLSDPSNLWRLRIPPNAIAQDFVVSLKADPTLFSSTTLDVLEKATEKARQDSDGYRFPIPGGIIEITVADLTGVPIQPKLSKQADLTHLYPDLIIGGAPGAQVSSLAVGKMRSQSRNPIPNLNTPFDDQKQIRLSTLKIWILDPQTQSWVKLPSNNIDLSQDEVHGGIPYFGVFAAMGAASLDVSDVIAYPVPWRPNGPNAGTGPGQTGIEAPGNGIWFRNIPQEGQIKIFDLEGRLIKEIPLVGNIQEPWEGRNTSGEKVASGTYFWIVEAAGNRKTGKVVVIR